MRARGAADGAASGAGHSVELAVLPGVAVASAATEPGRVDFAVLVGSDGGFRSGLGDRAGVQAVGQDHQVGGEVVAANVGGFPDLGMVAGQGPGERAAKAGAADVAVPVRADKEERTGNGGAKGRAPALGQ